MLEPKFKKGDYVQIDPTKLSFYGPSAYYQWSNFVGLVIHPRRAEYCYHVVPRLRDLIIPKRECHILQEDLILIPDFDPTLYALSLIGEM
jgi:hypothetical protein